jgi:hypothetical protein
MAAWGLSPHIPPLGDNFGLIRGLRGLNARGVWCLDGLWKRRREGVAKGGVRRVWQSGTKGEGGRGERTVKGSDEKR